MQLSRVIPASEDCMETKKLKVVEVEKEEQDSVGAQDYASHKAQLG